MRAAKAVRVRVSAVVLPVAAAVVEAAAAAVVGPHAGALRAEADRSLTHKRCPAPLPWMLTQLQGLLPECIRSLVVRHCLIERSGFSKAVHYPTGCAPVLVPAPNVWWRRPQLKAGVLPS